MLLQERKTSGLQSPGPLYFADAVQPVGPLMVELVAQNARVLDVMTKVVDAAQTAYAVAVKL